MRTGRIAAAMAIASIVMLPATALADTASILEPQHSTAADGWQAGPCINDAPVRCAPNTPAQFFKTAGGHPPLAFVQFIVRHTVVAPNLVEPLVTPLEARIPRTVRVDLPPGLSINPNATEKCSLASFEFTATNGAIEPRCSPGSKIGESTVNLVTGVPNFLAFRLGERVFSEIPAFTKVDLFNLEPKPGQPALFGFVLAANVKVFLEPEIAWDSDYHESFTIRGLPDFNTVSIGGLLAPVAIHSARLRTFGTAGDGTLATNPTTCFNADEPQFGHLYSSWIRMDSYGQLDPAFPLQTHPLESALPPGIHPEGCENIPFDPRLELDPGTTEVDSPASPKVSIKLRVEIPGGGGGPLAESDLRRAEVTLPEGMGLNPAGSASLLTCSDAQFHKGDSSPSNSCPDRSAIGTAQIRTPVLATPLQGSVYVGEPKNRDPTSGEEFRLLVEAKSQQRGVVVRLVGNVRADPSNGQLTAVFDEQEVSPLFGDLPRGLPQVPLESVTLDFASARPVFTSPPTCEAGAATGRLEPWARPGTQAPVVAQFKLSAAPAGGACPDSLGGRAFNPVLTAKPDSGKGGAYSPFRLHVNRFEAQQELKRIDLSLPPGLIGNLSGITYCPERAIAAARSKSGRGEQAAPSCRATSLVGSTSTAAGSGGEPLVLPGKVYLAGPYQNAPLSLVTITPAVSGPFDLGTVVIRVALGIDPTTAQIHAVSDLIPDVYGGVKLDLRTVNLDLDRGHFILNPTSCRAKAVTGAISGGGGNPRDPASFSAYPVRAPFQPFGCIQLGFAPKLVTTLRGPTKRHRYPRLTAVLKTGPGDANLATAALTLPHAFFVAQEHIGDVCTRPQLASHTCPPSSVYGEAEAATPLLDRPLKGPVYLVPGSHALPDLVADLRGQVEIQLRAAISSVHGRLKTVFAPVPDVPVSEFTLRMAGGKRGLIVTSTDVCRKKQLAKLEIAGQNGKQLTNKRYRLKVPGCREHHRKRHNKHGKH